MRLDNIMARQQDAGKPDALDLGNPPRDCQPLAGVAASGEAFTDGLIAFLFHKMMEVEMR